MSLILSNITSFDFKIAELFLNSRTLFWNSFFIFFTNFSHWIFVLAVILIVTIYLLKKERPSLVIFLWFATISTSLVTFLVKLIVNRSRPIGDIPLYTESLPSFPSAHAAMSLALFGSLFLCLLKVNKSRTVRFVSGVLFLLIIVLVGLSRVYLGVHFFSDVLAGYLVAMLCLIISIWVVRKLPFS